MHRRSLFIAGVLLSGGCLYNARVHTDETICALAAQPYDLQPQQPRGAAIETAAGAPASIPRPEVTPAAVIDIQTSSLLQPADQPEKTPEARPRLEPKIPAAIPGSETPPLKLPADPAERKRTLEQIYPELPALPEEPPALPGPGGQPYTLAILQQMAAANSPQLRQAASDVEAARGNLIQARAYPNPTVGWNVQPSNDGTTSGLQGPFIDQRIKTGGKLKLASAAAEMDLRNAELALRRVRADLSTSVRNAYFSLLVAKESVRVNRALAQFTDQIYRLHLAGQLGAGTAAPYEPAALRAQAYTSRLAYRQSIQTYIYAWKQLVAALGLRQLPLTEVAGRIDALIPYYDYDKVLGHVLENHTDALTARNGLDKARYNLKLAQVTPVPDVEVNVSVLKEFVSPPKLFVHTATIGFPIPIWDQNKGAVIAAEAAVIRATEEPHRVETALTGALATAYANYKQNLNALEDYRRHILPDLVRYYRGVLDRRQIDLNFAFADFVTAQQSLATSVTSYLAILGPLWSSIASVADLLQTDDLFQLAEPKELPPVPDLDGLLDWPCCHPCAVSGAVPPRACRDLSPGHAEGTH